MCILTYIPEGVQPDIGALTIGAENNDDGHGYALVDPRNQRIIVGKSMKADKLIAEFAALRKKLPAGPAMFHSRIATAGLVNESNCHPFRVGGDPYTVVGHNGILPKEAQPSAGDKRSDTRKFADQLLPMRNLDGARSMRKLAKWLLGDKLVILTVNPRWKSNAYLVNPGRGEWDDTTGIWYSNSSYTPTYGKYAWYRGGGRYMYDDHSRWSEAAVKCTGFDVCGRYTHLGTCLECQGSTSTLSDALKGFERCAHDGCTTETLGWFCQSHRALVPQDDPEQLLKTRMPDPCAVCQARNTVSTVTMVCTVCLTCQDCLEEAPGSCLCYAPNQLDREQAAVQAWVEGTVVG